MRGADGMGALRAGLAVAICVMSARGQTALGQTRTSDRDRLIGAWQLVSIAAPGADAQTMQVSHPAGMLVYTKDGHVSVQLMYPAAESLLSNDYVLNGFEASFGSYDVDEAKHTVTHHVEGANTRDRLVGKSLPRVYAFDGRGNLILKPVNADEHWSVTWKHY